MLSNAEVHVMSAPVFGLKVSRALSISVGAGVKIGRASHHFGKTKAQNRNRFSRCDASCHRTVGDAKCRQIGVPVLGKAPVNHSMKLRSQIGKIFCISFEARLPCRLSGLSARNRFSKMFQGLLGNMERRLYWPTHSFFGQTHLFNAERLPVGRGGVLLVWTPEANVGANRNQGRPLGFFTCVLECECNRFDVVAPLHSLYVPAESGKPRHAILSE